MKNFTLRLVLIGLLGMFGWLDVQGQTLLYGCSPFQDSMWAIDTTAGFSVAARMAPSLAGFTITGINGMAYDPCNHDTYVIMKVSGVSGRVLGKMNLSTGVCTQVGNLGDNFSSITFDATGQLYGVTGDGATVAETVYLIDKTTGAKTLLTALGNGADGEVICYNPQGDKMYHWSGNSTVIFEKFLKTAPFTTTNISGSLGSGETFGAINLGPNRFLISTINSNFRYVDTLGVTSGAFASLPDDLRGLVMPPRFTFSDDTICAKQSASFTYTGYTTDTVIYLWGDGTRDTLHPAGNATHTYLTPGTRTPRVVLRNACNPADTVFTTSLLVLNSPGVTLTPALDTLMCFADTLGVTGTSGGQSQWFRNGAPVPGATTNQFDATADGAYNMLKTNLNGCSDSAVVGIVILFGDQPTADLGADSTVCAGDSVCFSLSNSVGVNYVWSNGDTTAASCAATAGNFSVAASDRAGCVERDTMVLTLRSAPSPAFTSNTALCPIIAFSASSLDIDTYSWSFGDGGTSSQSGPTHTYTANGTYTVSFVAANACGVDSSNQTLTITCVVGTLEGNLQSAALYPNPSKGDFTLQAQLGVADALSYSVVDLSGRTLMAVQHDQAQSFWQEQIRLAVPSGMYFLHLVSGAAKATLLVVVE